MLGREIPGRVRSVKKFCRGILAFVFCVVICAVLPLPARAEVVQIRKAALENVTKAETLQGVWEKDGDERVFRKTDGSLVKRQWFKANGNIYYADAAGHRLKGWVRYRDNLYYLRKKGALQGALQTGWMEKGGKRYYFKKNGVSARGFFFIGQKGYYFDPDTGAALSGWFKIGKYERYFSKKIFRMIRDYWVGTDGKYYYVDQNGRKKEGPGWLKLGDKQYYLDASGARVTGTLFLDGKGYYFKKNGVYDPSVKVDGVDPSRPMVALTFDDGPGIYTERLLDCLKKNDAKATFFMVGSNVPYYKSAVKKMADMGCELGNHSYSHASFTSLSNASIASEISRTSANIRQAAGRGPTLARLPYGNGHATSRVLSALGLPSIYWSIDTRDWANTGNPAHTVSEVLNNVRSGDIVLMHDIHYSTIVAAEQIIPELKRRGYQLVTVSQLANYKGKTTLQNGRTYYHFR